MGKAFLWLRKNLFASLVIEKNANMFAVWFVQFLYSLCIL